MTGFVGRTPWSARDALVPPSAARHQNQTEGRRGRRPRTRGSALQKQRPCGRIMKFSRTNCVIDRPGGLSYPEHRV